MVSVIGSIHQRKPNPICLVSDSPNIRLYHDCNVKSGYREGITAGKEASLQEVFDAGFADVGVPFGRQVGMLRGRVAGILSAFSSSSSSSIHLDAFRQSIDENAPAIEEIREISRTLAKLRFSDIEPRDLEAEAHAREHLLDSAAEGAGKVDEDAMDVAEEMKDKKEMEDLEDALDRLTAADSASSPIPVMETGTGQLYLLQLRARLQMAIDSLGLSEVDWNTL